MSVFSGAKRLWVALQPPPPSPDGTMSLYDHLRELRYRVIVSAVAVVVTAALAAILLPVDPQPRHVAVELGSRRSDGS